MDKFTRELLLAAREELAKQELEQKLNEVSASPQQRTEHSKFHCRERRQAHSALARSWAAPACRADAFWTLQEDDSATRH